MRLILDPLAGPGPHARPLTLDAEVLKLFAQCAWPGNVRQLFNVLRTAAVLAGHGPLITRAHLPDDFLDAPWPGPSAPPPTSASPAGLAQPAGGQRSLEAMEIEAIQQAVDAAAGNISEASKRLGISRNTIYRKLHWNAPRKAGPVGAGGMPSVAARGGKSCQSTGFPCVNLTRA